MVQTVPYQQDFMGFTFLVPLIANPQIPRVEPTISRGDGQLGFGHRRDIICYGCGRTGHVLATCRYASGVIARDTAGSSITCYQCGQLGHMKRSCPQLQGQREIGGQQDAEIQQERVYAVTTSTVLPDSSVIRGIVSVMIR